MYELLTLTEPEEKSLKDYLYDHESDIACGISDYGDLEGLFVRLFKRKPEQKV